jgi:hypothetical protein
LETFSIHDFPTEEIADTDLENSKALQVGMQQKRKLDYKTLILLKACMPRWLHLDVKSFP